MKDFICPTCKRPTHPTDNEIIEHLAKEIDRYTAVLIKRTIELDRAQKALAVAIGSLKEISLSYQNGLDKPIAPAKWFSIATDMCDYADNSLEQITALEQKVVNVT